MKTDWVDGQLIRLKKGELNTKFTKGKLYAIKMYEGTPTIIKDNGDLFYPSMSISTSIFEPAMPDIYGDE